MIPFTIKTLTARCYKVIVPRKIQDGVKKHLKNRELINRFYKKNCKNSKRSPRFTESRSRKRLESRKETETRLKLVGHNIRRVWVFGGYG